MSRYIYSLCPVSGKAERGADALEVQEAAAARRKRRDGEDRSPQQRQSDGL
jgi:hypothetical protein